jgi:glutathione S-transferase
LVRTPPEKRNEAAIATASSECAHLWALLAARLERQPYVCGATLTLADIAWGPHVHRWFAMPIAQRPAMPALSLWYERLLARPAYRATCTGPLA